MPLVSQLGYLAVPDQGVAAHLLAVGLGEADDLVGRRPSCSVPRVGSTESHFMALPGVSELNWAPAMVAVGAGELGAGDGGADDLALGGGEVAQRGVGGVRRGAGGEQGAHGHDAANRAATRQGRDGSEVLMAGASKFRSSTD